MTLNDRTKSSHLLRAREMSRFTLGDERADVRGWDVYSNDAHLAGSVDSLFIDMHTKAVRYLGVALRNPETREPAGAVLVPVGAAVRPTDRRAILLRAISMARLMAAPRIADRPVTRADEDAALAAYGMATSRDIRAVDLYHGPNFVEDGLFVSGDSASRG